MKLDSKLNPRSDEFKTNQAAMQKLVDELEEKLTAVRAGGGISWAAKIPGRGQALAPRTPGTAARPRHTLPGTLPPRRQRHV